MAMCVVRRYCWAPIYLPPDRFLSIPRSRRLPAQGKTVHCKNAIFIMTSNLAQREIGDEGVALREEASRTGLGSKPTDQGMQRES